MSNLPAGVTDAMIEREFYGDEDQNKYEVTIVFTVYAKDEKEAVEYALSGNQWEETIQSVEEV